MDSDRIITPFGRESTAAQVIAGIDLAGRRAIVTGGSSGIGVETAGRWPAPTPRSRWAGRRTPTGPSRPRGGPSMRARGRGWDTPNAARCCTGSPT